MFNISYLLDGSHTWFHCSHLFTRDLSDRLTCHSSLYAVCHLLMLINSYCVLQLTAGDDSGPLTPKATTDLCKVSLTLSLKETLFTLEDHRCKTPHRQDADYLFQPD